MFSSSKNTHDRFRQVLAFLGIFCLLYAPTAPYWDSIFKIPKISETEAATSPAGLTTRTKTVEFFIGRFSGNGTTGKNTNTNNTLPDGASTTIRLAESGVVVKKAYIEYQLMFGAYSSQTIATSTFALDVCNPTPCTPNAWNSSGVATSTDTTSWGTTSGEAQSGRYFFDVSHEPQLLNYKGSASGSLGVQAGYRLGATAANSISYASAKLIITYTYDVVATTEVTNTVIYPLESNLSGDQGTARALSTSSCSFGSNCPTFTYSMFLPEFANPTSSNRLSQWFDIHSITRATGTTDQSYEVRVGTNAAAASTTFEEALSANSGGFNYYFSNPIGFTEATSSPATTTLEIRSFGAATTTALNGGEVFETYVASSSAPSSTKTVRYGIGVINTTSTATRVSSSVNVFMPEGGKTIRKAWFRITTSYQGSTATTSLNVITKVGGNAQSATTTYQVACSTQCMSQKYVIYHVIPSSDYAELEAATATSSKNIQLSTQWATARGGTSAELLITYTYNDESNGYQTSHSVFAGQSTSSPATSSQATNIDPVFADSGTGALSVVSGFLDTNFRIASTGISATMDVGAALSVSSSSCSVTPFYAGRGDNENSLYTMFRDVSSTISADDNITYTACYTSRADNNPTSTIAFGKFGGVLVYTSMYTPARFSQAGYHWRDDTDIDRYTITTVDNDTNGANGQLASITFASSGLPIVAYRDGNDDLRILQCGNEDCSSGNVTSSFDTNLGGLEMGIRLNASNTLSIAYIFSTSTTQFLRCGNLACTSGNATHTWGAGVGAMNLALRSNDFPVIAHYSGASLNTIVSYCTTASCTSILGGAGDSLNNGFAVGAAIEIASSSQASVFVNEFSGANFYYVMYRCNSSSSCAAHSSTTIGLGTNSTPHLDMALASGTYPIASYQDGNWDIHVVSCGNNQCSSGNSSSTIEDMTSFLARNAIRLDSNNNPIVVYSGPEDRVKIAYCDTTDCSSMSGKQYIDAVSTGDYVSIAVDSSNLPVIAYSDDTNTALKVAKAHFASSLTSGTQNASGSLYRSVPKRLRMQVRNDNAVTSTLANFQLQYGERSTTCAAITSWSAVGASGTSTVNMSDSVNITNGTSSLDVPLRFGGITNPTSVTSTFTAGFLADTTSTGAVSSIISTGYSEVEFSVIVTSTAALGTDYCFRLALNGATSSMTYSQYAEAEVVNAVPSITPTTIVVNNASSVILNSNATKTVTVSFQVTDFDGCSEVFSSGNVTTTLYRSGVGQSCEENTLNCYKVSSVTHDCSGGTSANATATFHVYYFAEATDTSTFAAENWRAYVEARDGGGGVGSATSSDPRNAEVLSLTSIEVDPASINYGTVSPGSNTFFGAAETHVFNTGNTSNTLELSGTAMSLGGLSLPTSSQLYASSAFVIGGSEQELSGTPTTVSGFTLRGLPISLVTSTTALSVTRRAAAAAIVGLSVYQLGGAASVLSYGTVYRGAVDLQTGGITSWTADTSLPAPRHVSAAVTLGNSYIYLFGGSTTAGAVTSSVIYTTPTIFGLGSWLTTTALPQATQLHTAVATGSFVYVIGGRDGSLTPTSSVYYTSSTGSGPLNAWQSATSLPATIYNSTAVLYGNRIYLIGGQVDGSTATSTIFTAPINSDGSLGSWTTSSSPLPYTIASATGGTYAGVNRGIIYVMGGLANGVTGPSRTSTILFAPIHPDGSIGKWSRSSSTLQSGGIFTNSVITNNNFPSIISIGGYDETETSSVYSAFLRGKSLFWGAEVPNGSPPGSYSGVNTFTAGYLP